MAINRSNQNWPASEILELCEVIRSHGFDAQPSACGSMILAGDEYIDRNGQFQRKTAYLPVDRLTVARWLGY